MAVPHKPSSMIEIPGILALNDNEPSSASYGYQHNFLLPFNCIDRLNYFLEINGQEMLLLYTVHRKDFFLFKKWNFIPMRPEISIGVEISRISAVIKVLIIFLLSIFTTRTNFSFRCRLSDILNFHHGDGCKSGVNGWRPGAWINTVSVG